MPAEEEEEESLVTRRGPPGGRPPRTERESLVKDRLERRQEPIRGQRTPASGAVAQVAETALAEPAACLLAVAVAVAEAREVAAHRGA